jgi:hypothetical protein
MKTVEELGNYNWKSIFYFPEIQLQLLKTMATSEFMLGLNL